MCVFLDQVINVFLSVSLSQEELKTTTGCYRRTAGRDGGGESLGWF